MKEAHKEAGTDMTDPKATPTNKKVSSIIHNKRLTLLEHIIRSDGLDPLRQVTFENANLKPLTPAFKRARRSRSKWVEITMKEAWNIIGNASYAHT